jgi:hypothetical protein
MDSRLMFTGVDWPADSGTISFDRDMTDVSNSERRHELTPSIAPH